MNTYGLIILLGLICEFVLHRIAEFFNLRYLNSPLPPLFQDVYDETQYARSQAYHRVNTYFGWIHSTWDLLLFLGFWFAKGFNALDLWIQSFHFHWIWNGLLYIGILGLAKSLLSLPFEIYDTFVIEEKFGFNKTTPKIFILDHLKALGLGIVLGGSPFGRDPRIFPLHRQMGMAILLVGRYGFLIVYSVYCPHLDIPTFQSIHSTPRRKSEKSSI